MSSGLCCSGKLLSARAYFFGRQSAGGGELIHPMGSSSFSLARKNGTYFSLLPMPCALAHVCGFRPPLPPEASTATLMTTLGPCSHPGATSGVSRTKYVNEEVEGLFPEEEYGTTTKSENKKAKSNKK